ncbi:MAG: FUSC family membrane protein [Caldimonas sp.]
MSRARAFLRPWRLLPAYAINGIEVALGIGLIQLLASLVAGPHAAQLVVSGAACASLADTPNRLTSTWQRVSAAALLSFAAALAVDLLRPYPLALGLVVAPIVFVATMTMAWGARAGAVSFAPILSLVFSMAVPPASGHALDAALWSGCGGLAYLAWAMLASAACQRRYRSLILVETLRAAAELFRSRAGVLEAMGSEAGRGEPLRAWIQGEGTLADRVQAARDLLFSAPESPRWHRDAAILLRVIDLRDVLIASRLDAELLGLDATGRAILDRVAEALRRIGDRLDRAAADVRDGTVPEDASLPPFDPAAGLADVPIAVDDARARLVPALQSRLRELGDDLLGIDRLLRGGQDALPLTREQLQLFVSTQGWPWRALRPHWRRDSLVLRHAVRMALALSGAYYLALALPWGSHPYWLVLSVAVVLRGTLGDTLARRNARVLGTMLGCLLVVGLGRFDSPPLLAGVFLVALGVAHAFVLKRYWLTASAASVMALLQSHLVNPGSGFAVAERVADTLLGALLAWCFSYVLPSWERRGMREAIDRMLRNLGSYAAYVLRVEAGDPVEQRLARREAYDSLAALASALQRSRVEPKGVRLPVQEIATLLDRGERLMAHLSMVRLMLARLSAEGQTARVGDAVAEASAAIAASLDPQGTVGPATARSVAAELELGPTQLAARDVIPWLRRRLALLVDEAAQIRAAAVIGRVV